MKPMSDTARDLEGSISIRLTFDTQLQKITGTAEYAVTMNRGAPFAFLLHTFLVEHPDIEQRYRQGELRFTLNGVPPKEHTPLFDNDVVAFGTITS